MIGDEPSKVIEDLFSHLLASEKRSDTLISMLQQLFPKMHHRSGIPITNPYDIRELRIFVPTYFDTYFRLNVSSDDVSNHEVEFLLDHASSSEEFSRELVDFAQGNTKRISPLFRRLSDIYVDKISLTSIPTVLNSLFDVGDQILQIVSEESGRQIYSETHYLIIGILKRLLTRTEEKDRIGVLVAAMSGELLIYFRLGLLLTWNRVTDVLVLEVTCSRLIKLFLSMN